jgi:hypothetical protein
MAPGAKNVTGSELKCLIPNTIPPDKSAPERTARMRTVEARHGRTGLITRPAAYPKRRR